MSLPSPPFSVSLPGPPLSVSLPSPPVVYKTVVLKVSDTLAPALSVAVTVVEYVPRSPSTVPLKVRVAESKFSATGVEMLPSGSSVVTV